jgi:phosphate ABC transporter phosphate-binding protein
MGNMLRRLQLAKFICSLSFLFLFLTTSHFPIAAQTADRVSEVKRIAVNWSDTSRASTAVRDRLEQKLRESGKLELVQNAAHADALLHGSAVIWITGYISTSPRSNAAQTATYEGYASVELSGKDGKTLWSYLATPRHTGWKNINDDLADQLANAFLTALTRKEVRDSASSMAPGGPENNSISALELRGAGATFPAPIYQKWFETFCRSRPDIQVSYDAVGSEQGIRMIRSGQIDFGASDMPLSPEQLQQSPNLRQFATVLGAVVPIYNVKGTPDALNLSAEVLAGIFLGKIQSWNAPEIREINKHIRLPDAKIVVVHRSDGSGTTYAWTDFLSKASPEWKKSVGSGTTVSWPVGIGAERNQGVADTVYKTPNSVGYVEFIYALQHQLNFAAVRNRSGDYVKADLDSVTAAAKSAALNAGDAFQSSITDASGKHTYPIASFTWVLIPAEPADSKKHRALSELLRWMLTTGQKQCQSLGYAPLPSDIAARELQALDSGK